MLKRTTILLSAVLFFLAVGPVWAQPTEVTVRQLNALPDGNVDALNAIEADPDGLIPMLIQPALLGDTLVVTVVVLSDPLNSGLASWVADNNAPGRIHIFERWETEEALKAHFAMPHMAVFQGQMGGFGIKGMNVEKYTISAVGPVA